MPDSLGFDEAQLAMIYRYRLPPMVVNAKQIEWISKRRPVRRLLDDTPIKKSNGRSLHAKRRHLNEVSAFTGKKS
jgi:CCAAT-binding transcription factor (CBF-B/NF-YA) subunit B